jgi:hypothetical protein
MLECANILRLEGLDEVPLDDGCEPWEKSFSPTPEFILEKNRWIWYLYTTAAADAAILIANFFLFSARDLPLLLLRLLCASTLRSYGDVPLRGQPNVGPKSLGSFFFFFFFFFEKEKNRI